MPQVTDEAREAWLSALAAEYGFEVKTLDPELVMKRGTLVNGFDWRPSTNMPEWASRYSVDIESTTLEQVGKEWQWSALLRLVDSRA